MKINIFYQLTLSSYYRKTGLYKTIVLAALGRSAAKNGEVNLIITDGPGILKINQQFLQHNYVTDVISFNYPFTGTNQPCQPFGDIFVCFQSAQKQASEQGHSILMELCTIIAHGALHLVGYDDCTPMLRDNMNAKATKIAAAAISKAKQGASTKTNPAR